MILSEIDDVPDLSGHEEWQIMTDMDTIRVEKLAENSGQEPYALDPETVVKDVGEELKEPEWLVDITLPKEVKPIRSNMSCFLDIR